MSSSTLFLSSLLSLYATTSHHHHHHHHQHRRFRHRIVTLPLKTKATMGKEPITTTATATSAAGAAPESAAAHAEFKLVGFKNFIRTNPQSDHFLCTASTTWSSGAATPLTPPSASPGPRNAAGSQIRPLHRKLRPRLLSPPLRPTQLRLHRAVLPFHLNPLLRCHPQFLLPRPPLFHFFPRPRGFLPGFEPVDNEMSYQELDYGIRRLDHAVGNVPELGPVVNYLKDFTGFHEFAEFTAEDVGTAESGLNSVVLANNNENVLFPLKRTGLWDEEEEPNTDLFGHNEGGVQHLALVSEYF
ncbi:UNVERIFIED_CONTAM: 4-hydroxyphenylpyruvate dioxygenase [Sesamum radiatum]|uniref:4-hydroxyphenylpyruvate dioxygenase n=1 Tax=Sesamum radiatum TaxID=300843 RepID=A0AAW2KMM2_SESRA